jgi:hypothetical protein
MLRYSTAMITDLSSIIHYINYRMSPGDAFLKLPLTGIVYDENAERTEQILFKMQDSHSPSSVHL